jgi:hypothetical protein
MGSIYPTATPCVVAYSKSAGLRRAVDGTYSSALPRTLSEINLVEIPLFAVFLGVFTLWSDLFEIAL